MSTPLFGPKFRRRARAFQWLAAGAAALAMVCVLSQVLAAVAPLWRGGDAASALKNGAVQAILGAPVLFYVWGLRRARRLFRRIAAGEVFTDDNSRAFAAVGWSLVAGAAWGMIAAGLAPGPADPLALQLSQIGVGARDLALSALGLALVLIGQVMAQATELKTDNDSFF